MFSLSDLSPTQEPFDLGNGRIIYFRNKQDFDLQELAAWERLRKTMGDVTKMRQSSKSEEQHALATQKSNRAARELISLILPDLSSDILEKLDAGKVDHLASMCIMVASGQLRGGSPSEDDLIALAEKWPDLPSEFLATLTRRQAQLLLGEDKGEETAVAETAKNRRAQPSKS
jgi:hypothetical protein